MEIKTKKNKSIPSGLAVTFSPENKVLSGFLHCINLVKYPQLIQNAASSTSFNVENATLLFYGEMDREDKEDTGIKEGEVSIYTYSGKANEICMNEGLFDQILFEYGQNLLKSYKNDQNLYTNWTQEMKMALESLQGKNRKKFI